MENNHFLSTILCILLILIAFCVLFLFLKHLMGHRVITSSSSSSSSSSSGYTNDKHCDDCCNAKTSGHCGKIRLEKSKAGSSGSFQTGVNVQLIATGFFDWMIIPHLDVNTGLPGGNPISARLWNTGALKHYISPIVTIQNQGSNPMSVGLYHSIHNPRGVGDYREAFKIPPYASTTVSYWKLMEVWSNLGGSGFSPFPVQLAVTGEDAKGCYVISWCCPVPDSGIIKTLPGDTPPFTDKVADMPLTD